MKNRPLLPLAFVALSALALVLGVYLVATKATLHPQLFITTCGEVIRNIQEHIHFNPSGMLSTLILFVSAISVSLALLQLIKFVVSYRRLHQLQMDQVLPDNLKKIMGQYNLPETALVITNSNQLTAYTTGMMTPRIVISQALIEKLLTKQLEAVVLHEIYHLRNHHLLWLLLTRLISSLLFFIPLIGHLAEELRTDFELAADAFVVQKQKTRDHLCNSLALNLRYVNVVEPHFATSPIERRVDQLVGNKLQPERIGMRRFTISLFSLVLMLVIAFVWPNQATADLAVEIGGVCTQEENCKTTDCSGQESQTTNRFTPIMLASYALSS